MSPGPWKCGHVPVAAKDELWAGEEGDTEEFFSSNTASTAYASNDVRSVRHAVRSSILAPSRTEASSRLHGGDQDSSSREKSLSFFEAQRPPRPPTG